MNESTLSYKGEQIPYLLAPVLAGERKRKFKQLVSRMGLMAEGVNCRGVECPAWLLRANLQAITDLVNQCLIILRS